MTLSHIILYTCPDFGWHEVSDLYDSSIRCIHMRIALREQGVQQLSRLVVDVDFQAIKNVLRRTATECQACELAVREPYGRLFTPTTARAAIDCHLLRESTPRLF